MRREELSDIGKAGIPAENRDPFKVEGQIRLLLLVVIVGLVISGLTAIPLQAELKFLTNLFGIQSAGIRPEQGGPGGWLVKVYYGLGTTYARFPFIAYGTDWLAFAHFVIAIAFIGPMRDPVKNIWVVEFGLIACVLVVPFALFMGDYRGIPWGWRLIDCSFGVGGFIPLWYCRKLVRELASVRKS